MLPESSNQTPARLIKSLANVYAHEGELERVWREFELAKQKALRTLMESQALLERAEQILSKR
jgi:hypothetical protein